LTGREKSSIISGFVCPETVKEKMIVAQQIIATYLVK
jgi:hypothetical protein